MAATTQTLHTALGHDHPRRFKPVVAHRFYESGWVCWAVVLADLVSLEISLGLGYLVRLGVQEYLPAAIGPDQIRGLVLGVLLMPIVGAYIELYPGYFLGPVERLRRRTYAVAGVFGALVVFDSIVLSALWSRGILLAAFCFALVIPTLVQMLLRQRLVARGLWGVPAVILGAGEAGERICRQLRKEKDFGLVPVCLLDNDSSTWGQRVDGVPVLGPLRMAPQLNHYVRVAITALPEMSSREISRLVGQLPFTRIVIVPDLPGIGAHWVTARDIGGYLGLEVQRNLLVPRNRFLKRLLDFAVGIPAIILSLPIIAVLALWIKKTSAGSPFYAQEREGLHGARIRVWKMRTMHPNSDALLKAHLRESPEAAEEWRLRFKLRNDPRLIPVVGSFLRRTSLDELPQLWNLLRGEMSLVGPRPFPRYHLEEFSEEFCSLRNSVLPGISGLWQVSGRSNGDLAVQEALDVYYIKNWSLWLDAYILFRTVQAVVSGRGAC